MAEANKVIYDNKVIIDLTEDTVTSNDLCYGVTAHSADGTVITGNLQNLDERSF